MNENGTKKSQLGPSESEFSADSLMEIIAAMDEEYAFLESFIEEFLLSDPKPLPQSTASSEKKEN